MLFHKIICGMLQIRIVAICTYQRISPFDFIA